MKHKQAFQVCLAALVLTGSTGATTIDFESQGAAAPSSFTGSLNSPLVIGIVTFTGGKLLKNEVVAIPPPADSTAVYATTGFLTGYTDPLVIQFMQPVSSVSLLVTNETADTYTLSDSASNSTSLAIGTNVNQTLSLNDTGITQLTISTAASVGWDFAIDNVAFTVSAPEPRFLTPLAAPLFIFFAWRRRRSR